MQRLEKCKLTLATKVVARKKGWNISSWLNNIEIGLVCQVATGLLFRTNMNLHHVTVLCKRENSNLRSRSSPVSVMLSFNYSKSIIGIYASKILTVKDARHFAGHPSLLSLHPSSL